MDDISLIAGEYRGVEELRAFGERRMALTGGTFTAEVHDVTDSSDHAVGLYVLRGERDGKAYEYRQVTVYHFSGDNISEIFIAPVEPRVADELFA